MIVSRILRIWFLGPCLWLAATMTATGQSANFKSFSVEDGLIQSQIQCLEQDAEGNLWIGTVGGLSRYNGKTFTNYTRKDGLAEDWITASCFDKEGNLWLGHWGGGVTYFNRSEKTFQDIGFEKNSKYKPISSMECDADGNIWMATENAGLFKYDLRSTEVTSIEGLSSNQIQSIVLDRQGRLWTGTSNGVCIVNTKDNSVLQCLTPQKGFPAGYVNTLALVGGHELWVGSKESGIVRINIAKEIPAAWDGVNNASFQHLTAEEGLASQSVRLLFEDHDHKVWISTEDAGVLQFVPMEESREGSFVKGEVHTFGNKLEMKYYQANVFFADREFNVWMGSDVGLNLYKGELFRLYNHNDNLPNNMIWTVLNDSRGNVWFGSNDGVTRVTFPKTPSGKRLYYSPVIRSFGIKEGLTDAVVLCLYEDSRGMIWIGTDNGGVCRLDPQRETIETVPALKQAGLATVFSIQEDKNGMLWFGTPSGAVSMDPASGNVRRYTEDDGLGGDKVYSLFRDSKDNLWMGVLGGYLTRYDGNAFKQYGEAEGLDQKFILGFAEDQSGNLWMISYGGGIYKYNGESFTQITTRDGLGSDSPTFIATDGQGNLWIGHNHGVERYKDEDKTFMRYGKREGYMNIETNLNAVSRDAFGNIWFGTIRGGVKLDPTSDRANQVAPVTSIDRLKIAQQDAPFPANATFPYEQNHLTFHVIGISLANPDQVTYKFMLEGFDDEWSPPQTADHVTYSNLKPGNYTLKVKAANRDKVWNNTEVSYNFTVETPFWMTWWFMASCALAVMLVIYSMVKIREKRMKARQRLLEKQVSERTLELRAEKEKVESQSRLINKKNQLITDSINYAQKIQEAILPSKENLNRWLPSSFILFKPKDIVSGDFYWVDKVKDKILLAAVDCTGHGVPGAFMSLIGHNLIDKIVHEYHKTNPADILTSLNLEVVKALKQDEESSAVKDGMDLAVCALDPDKMELEYAGAYNPLYIVRDGDLLELKADKIPIGKRPQVAGAVFKNQTHTLRKGDMLYMFSDGFPDQKGGPQKKKFYYPPFKAVLTEISTLPLEEQKRKLESTIEEWMKNVEQIDDILVFGVRI